MASNCSSLPELPYSLHTRKRSIAIQWGILLLPTCILTISMYFILRYGAKAKVDIALTVPTAILGAFTLVTFSIRTWNLLRSSFNSRPVGASKWECDYFTWNLILGTILSTALLASASGEDPPNVRQSSMPQAALLYLASAQLLLTGALCQLGLNTPISLSSTRKGTPMRPGVFVLIEDVVAVDGAGGQTYRAALVRRYETSPYFRMLLRRLNWFWGVGSLLVAAATTAVVLTVSNEDVAFALGWSLPWVWAAFAAGITTLWAQRVLDLERCAFEQKVEDAEATSEL